MDWTEIPVYGQQEQSAEAKKEILVYNRWPGSQVRTLVS
jgi:hypothetical protein